MIKYCFKRLARSVVSLAIVIAIVFCLLRLMPIEGYLSDLDKHSDTQIYNSLEKMGLNDPVPVQLGRFYKQLLHGDLGKSTRYRVDYPIIKIIAQKAPVSAKFGLISMAVSLPLGLLLGVFMARKKGGWVDKLGTAYIVFIQAVPAGVRHVGHGDQPSLQRG